MGPAGYDLRPTSDRLKETLFNILGPGIRNSVVLDVFAGTGAIGLEGISRGAREVVFIEQSGEGCRLIRRNLGLCGVSGGFRLLQEDAFTALRRLGRHDFAADVIFMDPPYDWQPYADLLDIVFLMRLAREETRVVIEHDRRAILPESRRGYRSVRVVRQGDHHLTFYRADPENDVHSPRI